MVYLKSVENVITLGKLIGLLFFIDRRTEERKAED